MDTLIDLDQAVERLAKLAISGRDDRKLNEGKIYELRDGITAKITCDDYKTTVFITAKAVECSPVEFATLVSKLKVDHIRLYSRIDKQFKTVDMNFDLQAALAQVMVDRTSYLNVTIGGNCYNSPCRFYLFCLDPNSSKSYFSFQNSFYADYGRWSDSFWLRSMIINILIMINSHPCYGQNLSRKMFVTINKLRDISLPDEICQMICSYIYS